jgi:hypothetical protein
MIESKDISETQSIEATTAPVTPLDEALRLVDAVLAGDKTAAKELEQQLAALDAKEVAA